MGIWASLKLSQTSLLQQGNRKVIDDMDWGFCGPDDAKQLHLDASPGF